MAISEQITLTDGVSGPAKAAASAIGGIATAIQRVVTMSGSMSGIAAQVEALSKAAAAGGIDKVNAKGAADQALAAQKAAAAAGLQDQKAAAADAMARNKAIAALIMQQAAAANSVATAQVKGATDAEQIQAKIAKEIADAKAGPSATEQNGNGSAGDSSMFGALADAMGQVGPIVSAAADAIGAALSKVYDLVEKGAQIAVKSGTFKEDTEIAFSALLGSAKAADGLYQKVIDAADRLGLDRQQTVTRVSKFISAGMDQNAAMRAVEAIAATTAVKGDAAGNKLSMALTKIEATDKFKTAQLNMLATAGIKAQDVYAALAKSTGKSMKEVQSAVKAGTIKTADAIKAIEDVILKGDIGKAAEKMAQTIPSLMERIGNAFNDLFADITTGKGGEAIKGFLSGILDALKGEGGSALKGALNDLYGNLGDLLGGLFSKGDATGGMKMVAEIIKDIATFVKDMTPGVKGFISGLKDGFASAAPAVEALFAAWLKVMSVFGGSESFWHKVGQGVAYFIDVLVIVAEVIGVVLTAIAMVIGGIGSLVYAVFGLIGDLFGFLIGIPGMIYDAFEGMGASGEQAGSDLMTGLEDGISGNATAVVQAVISACSNAILAAEKILGIASPSKVFHGIGKNVSKGAELGILAGVDGVENASTAMGSAAVDAANDNAGAAPLVRPGGAANSNAGAAAQGGAPQVHITVEVKGGNTNAETGKAVADATEDGVIRAFRKLGSERAA